MDFELTETQKMIKKAIVDFAENEVEPIAEEIDKTEEYPTENMKKLGQAGMLGIPFPEKYGGAGADNLSYIIAVEELSYACASHGISVSVHTSLCADTIYKHGNEEQKEEYLTPLASGDNIGAFALTEPSAGTDAGGVKTTAELDGDEYVLNGSKMFITNGGVADTLVILALTDPDKGAKGMSAFIVEADMDGFKVGKKLDKVGINASDTRELIFEDCRVPKENLLGEEGDGFKIAMQALDGGRIGVAAQALGIAQRALDESVQYVKEREQFGRPIGKFQENQFKLAEMKMKIRAARNLVYEAAYTKDNEKRYSVEAAEAKAFASDIVMDITREAIQLHGGYGYMEEYVVARLYRDAKITEIYEGTTEVMKMVVSGDLMK
ncbi:acyl-CoA dehydrogenase [Halanaerobaculum tunisiense]